MKLHPVNTEAFAAVVKACGGKVRLITADGDQLIANGNLSALIGLDTFLKVAEAQDITISCEKKEDQLRIERFIARYQISQ